jgi:hypothetical protein
VSDPWRRREDGAVELGAPAPAAQAFEGQFVAFGEARSDSTVEAQELRHGGR